MAPHSVQDAADHQTVISIGNLSVNLDNYRVAISGDIVDLTYHEIELLHLFMENADRILSYEFLAQSIWGNAERVTTRHLNVLVHRLRNKLAGSNPYWIETVRGRGYGLLKAQGMESVLPEPSASGGGDLSYPEVFSRTEVR
jgi:DNA-binding response OmpR family regulator